MTIKEFKKLWDDGNKKDFRFVVICNELSNNIQLFNSEDVVLWQDINDEIVLTLEKLLTENIEE